MGAVLGYSVETKKQANAASATEIKAENKTQCNKLSDIFDLTPEKIEELKVLYREVYSEPNLDSTHFLSSRATVSKKLKKRNIVYKYIYGDSVIVHNDTIVVPENTAWENVVYIGGTSYVQVPQVNINHFLYDGEKEDLRELASNANNDKDKIFIHEIRHANNKKYMFGVNKKYRQRSLHATDELLATVSGYLADYARIKDGKKWHNQYETTVYFGDINYVIPGDVEKVLDSSINMALDKISSMPRYRKMFIDCEGMAFRRDEPSATDTNTDGAIKKMQSDFVINGKRVDVFSLASEKVRNRAQDFINDYDRDMRLVKFAHDWNIKVE